jgi:DEAD/DEAH box helicase domain-containing protein
LDGEAVLSEEPLELPPTSYDTIAVRFDLPRIEEGDDLARQIGSIHGLEHALMAVAPFLAGCDRGDLGSAWYTVFPDTMQPVVFAFDKTPGGVGLTERLYESRTGWLHAAMQLLASCGCDDGCPGCLLSPRCEVMNDALHKSGTEALLRSLL